MLSLASARLYQKRIRDAHSINQKRKGSKHKQSAEKCICIAFCTGFYLHATKPYFYEIKDSSLQGWQ